ncbi:MULTISPECIES: hypothetical protein [unclassified Acinetobacter]|uniref:hypothetical protein n=1 Tax=unclassified Acinetobacter TaxID=196816 RepID=UPI00244C820D|nr:MULTISPECIES: hypothetical protein [unclassified Acinetobacter]MDH0030338.1 hypothetical protein [Acinetobacter sp. GD04021]MDH0885906.1 hypothetical protein [Acinetobacter sp. GD03873]MDH1082526.1 hypothetical protein [Acinetobacter sp. GD03983]MDH2189082.1 hypothetical protein [Acinetobacter sp. GD03645]MDH2202270.1 hypothetical protein [Acinetobacter sp. GD03647]
MKKTDFIATNKLSTLATLSRIYLYRFFQQQSWENGLAYEDKLRQIHLDFSIESLRRIDTFLDQLRQDDYLSQSEFIDDTAKQSLLLLLGFYCGEIIARAWQICPSWSEYEQYFNAENSEFGGLGNIIGPCFENFLVLEYESNQQKNVYFPLVAICERLFNQLPEKSVHFSVTGFLPAGLDPHAPLAETPNPYLLDHLPEIIAKAPFDLTSYLQMIPPFWMLGDELIGQMDALKTLYNEGHVVWGVIVQANNLLFKDEEYASCPAEIVYDPTGKTDHLSLRNIAHRLYELKQQEFDDGDDQDIAQYARHLKAEHTRFIGDAPQSITTIPLKSATSFIWRLHLPNGKLTYPFFPILISDKTPFITVLPAYFWQDTALYQSWLAEESSTEGQDSENSVEILPAFEQGQQQHLWQLFSEMCYPQKHDIPALMQTKPSTSNHYSEANEKSLNFVHMCQAKICSDYQRYEPEVYEKVAKERPDGQAKRVKEQMQAQLIHQHDFSYLLAELENQDFNDQLKQKGLPKAAEMLKKHKLSQVELNYLIAFLHQSVSQPQHETTALLYLAYLYLQGQYLAQDLKIAQRFISLAAINDWRAIYLQAEIGLVAPDLVRSRMYQEVTSQTAQVVLSNIEHHAYLHKLIDDFLDHAMVKKEYVRSLLQTAKEKGHPLAQQRLTTLIAQGKLPPYATPRYQNVITWLEYHIAQDQQEQSAPQPETQVQASSFIFERPALSAFIIFVIIILIKLL